MTHIPSFAQLMRYIFESYAVPHPKLVRLRQKCEAVAAANGLAPWQVAADVVRMFGEGFTIDQILELNFVYPDTHRLSDTPQ